MAHDDEKDHVRYWDYRNYTRSATTSAYVTPAWTSSTATTILLPIAYTTTALPIRSYAVPLPAHWSRAWVADCVKLINDDTRTGWKITMVIEGELLIVDPEVEIRKWRDFIPLLRLHASRADWDTIEAFITTHPHDPPAEAVEATK